MHGGSWSWHGSRCPPPTALHHVGETRKHPWMLPAGSGTLFCRAQTGWGKKMPIVAQASVVVGSLVSSGAS
jgi:hypothetical protein